MASPTTDSAPPSPSEPRWIELYAPGWAMNERRPEAFGFEGVSDVVLFGLVPAGSGVAAAQLDAEKIAKVTTAARAAKAHVLVCVGGEKTGPLFEEAGEPLAIAIARFVEKHALDGVVLDIEPLSAVSPSTLEAFVRSLRKARTMRVEAVVAPDTNEIARLVPVTSQLDRVAIMSYLGRGDDQRHVDRLRAAGFPAHRIGLGIDKQTSDVERTSRIASARRGTIGGLIVWHAGTVSSPRLSELD